MLKWSSWKNERETLHQLFQIMGKYQTECSYQQPQWNHVPLKLTPQGYSTTMLQYKGKYFSLELNIVNNQLILNTNQTQKIIELKNDITIKDYYQQVTSFFTKEGITPKIYPVPQEVAALINLDTDTKRHHYNQKIMLQVLELYQFAHQMEAKFINPLRTRKQRAGLYWGGFDLSARIIYNRFTTAPDPTNFIDRSALDESFIEFGFILGTEESESPKFFVTAYPFDPEEFAYAHVLPEGAQYSPEMWGFVFELKDMSTETQKLIQNFFFETFQIMSDYLKWENTEHYSVPLNLKQSQIE